MIRQLFLVSLLLSILAGCGSTDENPRTQSQYQDYLTMPHYRAFATTLGHRNDVYSHGWSSDRPTVESAIESALAACRKEEDEFLRTSKKLRMSTCKLHSVGNINVVGMNKEQVDKAIALYTQNKFATNEEFLEAVGQVPKTE